MDIQELIDNFSYFDNWEDKYRYLIELGEKLPMYPEKFRTEAWKVKGCQSQVWLYPQLNDNGSVHFYGDSDAIIVKGLISVVLSIYNDRTPSEIAQIAVDDIFSRIGLHEHLSPSRRNGLEAMIAKIVNYASVMDKGA